MTNSPSSGHKPVLHCCGASYKSAPLALRELMFLTPEALATLLGVVKEKHGFDELVVLSTCNRFEMYGMSWHGVQAEDAVWAAFTDLQLLGGHDLARSYPGWRQCTYYFKGAAASEHIFAVAASLDSLVIGETQITGQFKNAISLASSSGTLGSYLDRLSQEVLATAKKVRTQTRIGEKTVSISHAAIDLAKRVFRNLGDHQFLFIGAGEMAKVAALYARNYNPKEIYVANRTLARASVLVDNLGVGQAFSLEALPELLAEADIVVSSTSSLQPVILYPMLKQVMRQRRGRPLFLVDIAIPRDVEPSCGKLDDVYLFEIDDLQKVVEGNLDERRQAAAEARVFVKKGSHQYNRWLANVAVKPILANFHEYLQDICSREMAKTINRGLYKDLSEQQRAGLQYMLQAIASRMVADAAKAVNNPEEALREQLAASLRMLFSSPLPLQPQKRPPVDCEKEDASCPIKIIRL